MLAAGAAYCYGWSRFGWLLVCWAPYMAGNVWLTALLLCPAHPVWFAAIAAVFAGVPVVFLSVIVADMRLGLFPLDTFYGLAAVIVLTPSYFVLNLVLLMLC